MPIDAVATESRVAIDWLLNRDNLINIGAFSDVNIFRFPFPDALISEGSWPLTDLHSTWSLSYIHRVLIIILLFDWVLGCPVLTCTQNLVYLPSPSLVYLPSHLFGIFTMSVIWWYLERCYQIWCSYQVIWWANWMPGRWTTIYLIEEGRSICTYPPYTPADILSVIIKENVVGLLSLSEVLSWTEWEMGRMTAI